VMSPRSLADHPAQQHSPQNGEDNEELLTKSRNGGDEPLWSLPIRQELESGFLRALREEQEYRQLTGMTMSEGVGNCAVAGYCFSNYVPGENYGRYEDCTFTADGISGPLLFTHFDIYQHSSCSYGDLTIGGTKYCGDTAPTGLSVTAGEQMTFHSSQYSWSRSPGFRACVHMCSSACGEGSACGFVEGATTPSCLNCPANTYSDVSSTTAQCVSYGSGMTANTGSTSASACICDVGFYLNGASCASCGSGTTASTGSTSSSACICDVGFYVDGDTRDIFGVNLYDYESNYCSVSSD